MKWVFFILTFFVIAPATVAQTNVPVSQNPDVNVWLRGYKKVDGPLGLIDFSHPLDAKAPQLTSLIEGNSSPVVKNLYQFYAWDGSTNKPSAVPEKPPPDAPTSYASFVGFGTTAGQRILVPSSVYDIGSGYQAVVLYATDSTVTINYTRNNTITSGYTIHLDNITVDSALLAAYQKADGTGRTSLPAVGAGFILGRAKGIEIRVSIRDTGAFMDPRWRQDWWHGQVGIASPNQSIKLYSLQQGLSLPIAPSYTLGNRNYPEESEESCSVMEGGLGDSAAPEYRDRAGEKLPGLRTDAGLNHGTSVRGTYCGQQRGDSLILRESNIEFDLTDKEQCRRVAWTGTVTVTGDKNEPMRIPFAGELADQWAGTLDAEHLPESEVEDIRNNPDRASERSQKMGVMRYLLPTQKQDELKCSFVNYVRRKGGTSTYTGFRVDGKLLTDLECPPTAVESGAWQGWNKTYGKAWGMIGLVPNEKSTGEIKFQVCDDLTYVLTQQYPEVMRLGLAANELFGVLTPYDQQKNFYGEYTDLSAPLTQSLVQAVPAPNAPTGPGLVIANAVDWVKTTIGKVFPGRQLAQACVALEPSIEVVSQNPFVYALVIKRSTCAPSGVLGDIQINPPSNYAGQRGPHIQSMAGNELRFLSTYEGTDSFMPKVSSAAELGQYSWRIEAKRLPEGYKIPELFVTYKGATSQMQVPQAPQCKETKDCAPSTAKSGQMGPSDVTVWSESSKNVSIGSAGHNVEYVFKVPAWKPNDPLPAGCSVNVVPVDYDSAVKRLVKRSCKSDTQCGDVGACNKAAGYCGEISCVREHDRVVDVYNNVPFLGSIWEQAAGYAAGKYEGFLNMFKVGLEGQGNNIPPPFTGCSGNPEVVFDVNGRFVPRPAASEVTYRFDQKTGRPEVVVTMSRPPSPDTKMKILFYRLGGVCNANDWVSGRQFMPADLQDRFGKRNVFSTPAPSQTPTR